MSKGSGVRRQGRVVLALGSLVVGLLVTGGALAGVVSLSHRSSGRAVSHSSPGRAMGAKGIPPSVSITTCAHDVTIPITRTGHYDWTSPPVVLPNAAPDA